MFMVPVLSAVIQKLGNQQLTHRDTVLKEMLCGSITIFAVYAPINRMTFSMLRLL